MSGVFAVTSLTLWTTAELAPGSRSGWLVLLADKAALEIKAVVATAVAERLTEVLDRLVQLRTAMRISTTMA
jgi:hypothetical protein